MGRPFARVVFTERELGQLVRLSLGLEQVVYIEADRGPLTPQRVTQTKQLRQIYGKRPAGVGGHVFYAVERALDSGATLHVVRLTHYTDPTDSATATGVASSIGFNDQAGAPAPKITASINEIGTGGDAFSVTIATGTVANTFKATLVDSLGLVEDEVYDNLSVDSDEASYFETVVDGSTGRLVLLDVAATATPTFPDDLPEFATKALATGSNGTAINAASIIGDLTAGTGFHAASPALSETAILFAHQNISSDNTVVAAGMTYGALGDICVIQEVPDHTDVDDAVDFRNGTGTYSHTAFDSSFGVLIYGRHKVFDVTTSTNVFLPVVGELAPGLVDAFNESLGGGFWLAPAGDDRGKVSSDVLGLSDDVGVATRSADANKLTEAGIVPYAGRTNGIRLWGNTTMLQDDTSLLQSWHVRNTLLTAKRLLLPAFDKSMFNPNLPSTWKPGYLRAKPILASMASKGAIIIQPGFTVRDIYLGDIDVVDASDEDQYTSGVNTPTAVANGTYKVRIILPVASAIDRPLEVIAEVTNTAVRFEEFIPTAA